MRMRFALFIAGLLAAAPLAAQQAEPSAAWLPGGYAAASLPATDPRLRVEAHAAAADGVDGIEARSRMPLHVYALLGAAAGCVTGALILGAGADDGEVAPMRFNGCILGGAVGGFLGGIAGLIRGA